MTNTEVRRHGQWLKGAALLLLFSACPGPGEVSEGKVEPYIVRFVFEGTLGFYSEKWNDDDQSPFFVLIPAASQGHEPAILIHERFVQDSIGDPRYRQPSGQRTGGMVEYGLLGEKVGYTATNVITPDLTKHRRKGNPENRPCQGKDCGAGSDYAKEYRARKRALDWLAPVEWFAEDTNSHLNPKCLNDACSGDSKALLAGRLMFEKGVVKTHRLEGEVSASQVDGELRKFKLQFKNGKPPEKDLALASSVAVEIKVSGDLEIWLDPIYVGARSTIPVKRSNESVVEIFVVNLPGRDAAKNCPPQGDTGATGSQGADTNQPMPCPVLHFKALHTLLLPFPGWSPDVDKWGVPVWESSGSAGDEACPPGCYNCR